MDDRRSSLPVQILLLRSPCSKGRSSVKIAIILYTASRKGLKFATGAKTNLLSSYEMIYQSKQRTTIHTYKAISSMPIMKLLFRTVFVKTSKKYALDAANSSKIFGNKSFVNYKKISRCTVDVSASKILSPPSTLILLTQLFTFKH